MRVLLSLTLISSAYAACPPGQQDVDGSCVDCADGETSTYDGTCSATCAAPRVAVGKKCVYKFTTGEALKTRMQECICGNTDCNTYSSTQWRTGAGDAAAGCGNEIQWYDVSEVTAFSNLFYMACKFNYPLNEWDVSNADLTQSMFQCFPGGGGVFNQPLDKWDVSTSRGFRNMFRDQELFNQDISSWDVSSGLYFQDMFNGALAFNQPVGNWDLSSATGVENMFRGAAAFNQSLSLTLSTTAKNIFAYMPLFTGDGVESMDISRVGTMEGMFLNNPKFNGDVSAWDVSRVTSMRQMFSGCTVFNVDITNWDVSNVEDMYQLFGSADSFNQDISSWDVRKVLDIRNIFFSADVFDQDLSAWAVNPDMIQFSTNAWPVQTNKWDGPYWVALPFSYDPNNNVFPATRTGPTCPHNFCLDVKGRGSCSDGVCSCNMPFESHRCIHSCPDNKYNLDGGCDQCATNYARFKTACRPTTKSELEFLSDIKGDLVGEARSKAVREKFRPEREAGKTEAEMMVTLPVEKTDLTDGVKALVEEIEAKVGAVELEMSVAAPLTDVSSATVADCHLDLADQEPGKKTVVHPYDVGNYVFMCDSTSGSNTFVAKVKELSSGSEVTCWDGSAWSSTVTTVNAGDSTKCGEVPILIGSMTAGCGGGSGCCSDDECVHGTCESNVCSCDEGFEGETCATPSECKDIVESGLYQKKGCCEC